MLWMQSSPSMRQLATFQYHTHVVRPTIVLVDIVLFFNHIVQEVGDGIGEVGDTLNTIVDVAKNNCSFFELW